MFNAIAGFSLGTGLIAAIVAAFAVWRGYILSILWAWFLVPLGAPVVSIPLAIGFALIVSYLTNGNMKKVRDIQDTLLSGAFTPLLFLGIGWIVKMFL